MNDVNHLVQPPSRQPLSGKKLFLLIFGSVFLALLLAGFLVKWWLFPSPFTPVSLSATETSQLEQKLEHLPYAPNRTPANNSSANKSSLTPRAYSEKGAIREVEFSEREINALIANNSDLAEHLVVDLSDDLISAQLLIPLDPDFPLFGGQTLRVSSGVEFSINNGKPRVVLQGVSVWGVPLPNAWLGNLKEVDLISEFGGQPGFWKQFAAGVENIQISNGELVLELKE